MPVRVRLDMWEGELPVLNTVVISPSTLTLSKVSSCMQPVRKSVVSIKRASGTRNVFMSHPPAAIITKT